MKKRMRTIFVFFVISLVSCFLLASLSFAQKMPKPGEVIDKNNIKNYAHLFPEEFLPYFETGYGLVKPISIKVSETKPSPIPKKFLTLSEKNHGKVTFGKDGMIVGYDLQGLPFPGITKDDKDFAAKEMWNFQYRYTGDDLKEVAWGGEIRKGERPTYGYALTKWLFFFNRCYIDPKPIIKSPNNLYKALLYLNEYPTSVKNLGFLTWRYADPNKSDDTYLYLPTLRRVLRGEAGQRSTPVQGTCSALDDFNLWDGRTFEFTYEFVGERKILGLADSSSQHTWQQAWESVKAGQITTPTDGWELKDVYVIDIKPKDVSYPQGKKRVYIDRENFANIYYAIAWDRAGKLWKTWIGGYRKFSLPDGDQVSVMIDIVALDVQYGVLYPSVVDRKINIGGLDYTDFMPTTMLKLVR